MSPSQAFHHFRFTMYRHFFLSRQKTYETASRQYYAELHKTGVHNEQQQLDIAHAWYTVGVLLEKYDHTLAQRLSSKSRYWREGATWSPEVIEQARIGLDDIDRSIQIKIKE